MPRRDRKMKGGFWDTLKSWGSSVSQGASNAWDKTKKATTSAYDSATGAATTSNVYSSPTPTNITGGRSRKHKRGGFKPNTPANGLASHSAPVTGIPTAKPHNMVGGKTKKYRGGKHRHSKSCKHRKH